MKPYQTLLTLDESPHLPHGYSLMVMMSFFPDIWFSVMDPLVEEYKKIGIGNIHNEVTMKSMELTKEFMIKLGTVLTSIWVVNMLLLI